jgi:zinc protease
MARTTSFLQRLPTSERTLANGLTVVVRSDRSAPVVAVVTHVRAGYFDEPDELVGISHVLEHMYFKGTAQRGVGEIARETKEAGGYLNAGTIYDRTSYYTVLPASSLEQALDIQSDALQRSAIDDDELRRELQVIVQEAKRKLDNPSAVAQETLFETMFDVHRIRRWRIGTETMLRRFTRQDVWEYYRNLYRASNTILVIAGDVDADHAFELAERHYRDMPAGEPVRREGEHEPERRGFRYRELMGDIAQSYIEWGWRTPGTLHPDTAVLDVLAIALGQGRASRLYRHVRDAGAVAAVSAYNYTPTTLGIFGIGAELDPRDAGAALRRIAAVVATAREHGFTPAETERARNILEARLLRRMETAEGQANLIAEWQALGDWRLADEYLSRVMAVTPEQLHDAARRYLDPDALTALLYRPASAPSPATDAATLREELFGDGGGSGVTAQQSATLAPGAAGPPARSAAADSAAGPPVRSATADSAAGLPARSAAADAAPGAAAVQAADRLAPVRVEDDVRFYELGDSDGRIIIKTRATAPLVSISLHCRGGMLAERLDTAGLTALMARTSVKGTRSRTGIQLAEETEALGAGIGPGVASDMLDWSISLPARHFERGLELLLDAALEPAFHPVDGERERKIALSDMEQLRDDMHHYPLRLVLAAAFPDHSYGFDVTQVESSLRALDVAALHGWHRERVLRGAPHVFVVGDIGDADRAAAMVAARLKGRVLEAAGLEARATPWGVPGTLRAETRDKAQTALALAFPGPPRNHPDIYALQVLSAAIAGLGGRLFEELRSRRSLAYAVSASPVPRWLGGAFIAYIGTAPEREDEAREALVRELVSTGEQLLDDAEVERARRYLIGAWQIRQQTHSRQLADLAYATLLGEGLVELREFEQRIRNVDATTIRTVAQRWLDPARMVQSVVRGTARPR